MTAFSSRSSDRRTAPIRAWWLHPLRTLAAAVSFVPAGAVSEGALAYKKGLPVEDCPYPPGSGDRQAWLHGWNQAAAAEAEESQKEKA